MEMSNLSALFSQKLGIHASFYLTEDNFAAQRFLYAGIPQLEELAEMKKAGQFDFETVLLLYENNPTFEKNPADTAEFIRRNAQASIAGFVMIERRPSSDPSLPDTGNCLVFTPAVSDMDTKSAFYSILPELISKSAVFDCPTHQIEISPKAIADDIREYYSKNALSFFKESNHALPPYDSIYSPARVSKAAATLQRIRGSTKVIESGKEFAAPQTNVLEICCGNGMSTLALHNEKINPVCIDINEEDICIGLSHGVLKPEKIMIMDATTLSKNLNVEQFDTVIGFMIGTIYEFNKEIWFSIADESVKMLKQGGFLLFTLREEHEANRIADHLKKKGIDGEIIDNRDDETNYDSWIYFAQK
ncbi:MAG: class I SAM-dependent methyltransferase [Methanosarcinales archaeon]|jgi:2-polyprenyl-3-methyl-5-hydroxy-6-metoxy-1,4-benzoquinol methylase|nr:class I SAM-dependent methyltransferase [Methanosarcinales archaeon]